MRQRVWPGCLGLALTASMLLSGGCRSLLPSASAPSATYALDGAPTVPVVEQQPMVGRPVGMPLLVVSPPRAAAGFDSHHIVYVREAHRLEYFAHSEWIEPPAHMLAPLIVASLEATGSLRAVSTTPSSAASDLRLDTEVLRLQQEFGGGPSRVRFTLRATLVDSATRELLSSREFDATVTAASDDPVGGVAAANLAVQEVLAQMARRVGEAAAQWQPARDCSTTPCPSGKALPKALAPVSAPAR